MKQVKRKNGCGRKEEKGRMKERRKKKIGGKHVLICFKKLTALTF